MTTRRGHVALAGLSAPAQGAGDAPIAAAKPLLSTAAVIDDWLADLGLADVLRAGIEAWIPGTSEDAFARVLVDAETILAEGCSPLDAGMWGSEMLGMLALPGLEVAAVEDLVEEMVVPMAEASCTPTALAVLSVLGALGGPRLSRAAALARQHLVGAGVVVPHWSESLGAPRVGSCWVYGDDFGDQESLVLSFAYGRKKHAVCVLIDHTLGGGVGNCCQISTRYIAYVRSSDTLKR